MIQGLVFRRVSATLATLIVAFEAGSAIVLGPPLRGSALEELVAGVVILLLPAGLLLTRLEAGPRMEKASLAYPVTLFGGIWLANSFSDALAYGIIMGLYLAPLAIAYAVALIAGHLIQRRKLRTSAG